MKAALKSDKITVFKNVPVLKMTNQYGLSDNRYYEPTSWSIVKPYKPDNMVLWQRVMVTYNDGTIEYLAPSVISDIGYGTLEFSVSKQSVDFYVDGIPLDDTEIFMEAKCNSYAVKISIDGEIVKQMNITKTDPDTIYIAGEDGTLTPVPNDPVDYSTDGIITYAIKPSVLLKDKESVTVVAYTFYDSITYTIRKNTLVGVLTVTADKTTIPFYADNFPHDESDKITLSVTSENYKNSPKLYIDNELQETEDSASYTFSVPQSMLASKLSLAIKVSAGSDFNMITLTKTFDIGSIDLTSDKTTIGYYADNVAHNDTELATFTITQSGYYNMPTLYIDGVETEYSSSNGEGTYQILATQWRLKQSITARIAIENQSKSVTVSKVLDSPAITLTLSEAVAEYYADNVAITGDITAEVGYSGLFYAPLLRIGDTPITLSNEGTGTIPISLFDNVDSGLTAIAYAQKNIIYSTSVSVAKQKRPLVLSLGSSGSQFSYDNEGTASPTSITLTNNTQGLSDKGKATLVVGGELKEWADGTFTITPDMVTGRYLAATISYGSNSSTLIITKTYDGKAETVEYSKTKSFRIYPDEEYEFTYNDTGVVYNGETMAWVVPWSSIQPDISSNEYLWRRSRTSETDEWQYTRLTGIKGDDGKAGEYLGHYTEAPTTKPDGSEINDGDYYLNTSEIGSPLPYIYKDGQWVLVTADNPMWSQIASDTIGDVNNYGGSLLSTSAYYGYFQALSAQKAFIKSLGTQEITLSEGGAIQSESYGTSGGAEGFRIGADGNVDFNSGIWRGSFANGLSFIPPTNITIKKTMTQKEAYQALKKAGVVSGVYRTTNGHSDLQNTGTAGYSAGSGSASSLMRTGNGFTCLDYDSLDMQTPLFSPFNGIIPIDGTYMIGFLIETVDNVTTKNAYLITKSMLAKHQWNDTYAEFGAMDTSWDILSHPLAGWGDRIQKLGDYYAIYGTVIDGKLVLYQVTSEGFSFSLYHVDGDNMTLVKDGDLDLGSSSYSLTRWLIPAFYYHKKGSYYETSIWTGLSFSDFNHFSIVKTTDFLSYETVKAIALNYPTDDADFYNIPIPADIVYVDNRVFAQIVMRRPDDTYLQGFAEYNESISQWEWIPDSYTQYAASSREDSYALPSLCVKGNAIYGTYSGHEFFSYDTDTNTYRDLSEVFRTSLINQPPSGRYDNTRTYLISPPHYATRIDSDVTRTATGTLPAELGSYRGKTSISLDTTASYLVAKYGNEWLYAVRTNSSYQFYTAGGSIKNFKGYASSISIPAAYQKRMLTIYEMNNVSISNTTYEAEPSITDSGIVRNVDVTYTFTKTDSSVYTEHLQLVETTHYSRYMEWDTLRIVALSWSSALNAIMVTARIDLGVSTLTQYLTLVYDIETDSAKNLAPLATNLMGGYMIPLCQYAETGNDYIAISGAVAYVNSVADSDKMSFTMNNVHLEDLLDYYNGSKTIDSIMFPSPSSVPAIYRIWAKAWAEGLYERMANALEYDGKRMIRNDEMTLALNCVTPYFAQGKMIIRETEEKYEIFLADPQWRYFLYPTFTVYPSFFESSYNTDIYLYYSMFFFKFEISPNSNMYPIISIDKDSEELMTATFTWDFPAQLTANETIKSIAKDDFFCSPINLVYSNAASEE